MILICFNIGKFYCKLLTPFLISEQSAQTNQILLLAIKINLYYYYLLGASVHRFYCLTTYYYYNSFTCHVEYKK